MNFAGAPGDVLVGAHEHEFCAGGFARA